MVTKRDAQSYTQGISSNEKNEIRFLVADDEELARESVISKLQNMGLNNVYEAENGLEAYEKINSIEPDIVIADIRMPGMDGIELLSRVKETNNSIIFIFISGYDLFEYAQKALRLGAFNYLLKPFNEIEFINIIDKACDLFLLKNITQKKEYLQQMKLNLSHSFMRKHFVFELASKESLPEDYINSKLQNLNISFHSNMFCIIIVCIDGFNALMSDKSLNDVEITKSKIEDIINEVMDKHKIDSYSFDLEDGQGFILNFIQDTIHDTGISDLYDICFEAKKAITEYCHFTLTIGIGILVDSIYQVSNSYKSARKCICQRLVKGGDQVFYLLKENLSENDTAIIGLKFEQEFLSYLEINDMESAMKMLDNVYKNYRSMEIIDMDIITKMNLQVIFLLFKFLHANDIIPEDILGDEFMLYNLVNTRDSIEAMLQLFNEKLQICLDSVLVKKGAVNTKLIQKSKEFIHNNINRDISLEVVSEYVHLNPNYFSRMFKNVCGENFVNYVLNYRINKAKELLKVGIYKNDEVCKIVGFNDEKHFFKVFKRLTGCTPGEYRKL